MVPVALRPARDTTGPCLLWSDPRFGWNCPALPPPVGRARASDVDEPGQRDTWQRAPLVLSRRRFRYGTEKGARARRPARRGAAGEPEYWNKRVRAPGSGRILRYDWCILCGRAEGLRGAGLTIACAHPSRQACDLRFSVTHPCCIGMGFARKVTRRFEGETLRTSESSIGSCCFVRFRGSCA